MVCPSPNVFTAMLNGIAGPNPLLGQKVVSSSGDIIRERVTVSSYSCGIASNFVEVTSGLHSGSFLCQSIAYNNTLVYE